MSPAAQLALWGSDAVSPVKAVNVAQIPQRSPFRYPGGKTWLVPHVRSWLGSIAKKPRLFIEPFAGGGIISLTVAFEDLAQKVLMVELDRSIAAVWHTLLSEDNDWLARKIATFDMTLSSLRQELDKAPNDTRTLAFHTLLRNRTCHGGILAPGSGILKYGENGRGIASRWYPETLRRRIQNIKHVRDRITFVEGDGIKVINEHAARKTSIFFVDPPYTAAGKKAGRRLYVHHQLEHDVLFKSCEAIAGDFLMTYDNADDLVALARTHCFETATVTMTNTHHATMRELLISKNLRWIRR